MSRDRIDIAVLNFVAKLRMIHGERESEVHRFLGVNLGFVDPVDKLDFLLAIKQNDFGFDARRIDRRAFHFRHRAKRCLDHGNKAAAARAVRLKLRLGQSRLVLERRVARLVGARHVDILVEPVGAR